MATTVISYPFSADKRYVIPFEYLARRFVELTLVSPIGRQKLVVGTDYRFLDRTTLETVQSYIAGDEWQYMEVRRNTSATDRLVDFNDGSILRANDLNVSQIQSLHIAEESEQLYVDSVSLNDQGLLDARGRVISNVSPGINPSDAATVGQIREASASVNKALRVQASEPDLAELPIAAHRKGLVLGFNDLGNPTMVIPAPSSVEDVMLRLAGSDGSMFVGNGNYPALLQPGTVAADLQYFPLKGDVKFYIPDHFPDLQSALDWASTKKGSSGKSIEICMRSAYKISKGFRIEDCDLGHVVLSSEDPTVGVTADFQHISTYDLPAGVARGNMFSFVCIRSTMPRWNTVIDHSGAPSDGGYCLYWSRGFVYNFKGVHRVRHDTGNPREGGAGFKIGGGSWLMAPHAVATECDIGFALTQSTIGDLQYTKATKARITGIDVSRGSIVYALNADVSDAIGEGFYVRRSRLIAEAAIIKNCPIGIRAQATAEVSAVNAQFDGTVMAINRGSCAQVEITGATIAAGTVQLDTRPDLLYPSQINFLDPQGYTLSANRPAGGASSMTSHHPAAGIAAGQITAPPRAYATVHELSTSGREILGGTIYGHYFGIRITVDGIVVLNTVANCRGAAEDGKLFTVYSIPPFRSAASYKIEVYNLHQTQSSVIGYNLFRRI